MKKINLIFGVHNHQPVGNFGFIFEEAYAKAYLPFLEIMRKHPKIKITFHYSGPLWLWLQSNHPEFIQHLKNMVEIGQAEIMTGGFYEPIFSILYDRDKQAQIKKLTTAISEKTGYETKGMWLAERVWEPHLVKPIKEAGVEYVVVDDYHFTSAGLGEKDLLGYYITEEQGKSLFIFPISKKLRYLIPFRMPQETMEYCSHWASEEGEKLLVIIDDGEKFGIWPQTHHSVYEEKWMERFLTMLEENSSWIETTTFSEYIKKYPPLGRVYLPCASYAEMMEWSLPAETGELYSEMIGKIKAHPEQHYLQFIKGGFWRNFLTKYEESNNMHKKMLYVSDKLQNVIGANKLQNVIGTNKLQNVIGANLDPEKIEEARDMLLAAQCNDAYWHGVFGGLYMAHLRRAIYENLIKSENLIDKLSRPQAYLDTKICDFDHDGQNEIVITNPWLNLYFSPHNGGRLFELDYKPKAYNLTNVLTRYKEAYHKKIIEWNKIRKQHDTGVKTIHEQLKVKEEGLDNFLKYDWYRRVCLLEHFLSPWADLESFYNCNFGEKGDFVDQPYQYELKKENSKLRLTLRRDGHLWVDGKFLPLKLTKEIVLQDNSSLIKINYRLFNPSELEIEGWFGVEFSFAGTSGQDADCFYYTLDMEKQLNGKFLNTKSEDLDYQSIGIKDKFAQIDTYLEFDKETDLWRFPLETVSQSEDGFERSYQGSVIFPHWKINLQPAQEWSLVIKWHIRDLED